MKTQKNWFVLAILLLVVVATTVSCKKDKDDDNDVNIVPKPENTNGLGDNNGFPTGTQFNLPPWIELIGEIRGGEYYGGKSIPVNKHMPTFANKELSEYWQYYGSGTYVDLYLTLHNTLTTDSIFTIPGGLIFIDSTKTHQHGFVLQTVSIPVLALDTTYAVIKAYCANLSRSSSSWEAIYHFGPVSNNSELVKIVNILKTKQLLTYMDYEVSNEIQDIVWDVTDYNQILTQAQLNYLNSLP
jgi:hypothetical protein